MQHFHYKNSPYQIRESLVEAHRDYWLALAQAGTWFTGPQRVAIAAEVRNALDCAFCQERKNALSPYSVKGSHLAGKTLAPRVIDTVHRIISDQSRITQAFVNDNTTHGLSEEEYVELVGVATTVFSIDEFNRALGLPLESLPEPVAGEPNRYRPKQAEHGTGFVAMLPRHGATGRESDLWPNGKTGNVVRALTLVPDALREWIAVATEQYLSIPGMSEYGDIPGRSLNRMQMELVAGRVSSINECFY